MKSRSDSIASSFSPAGLPAPPPLVLPLPFSFEPLCPLCDENCCCCCDCLEEEEYIFGGVGMSLSSKAAAAGGAPATAPLGVAALLPLTSFGVGVVAAAAAARAGDGDDDDDGAESDFVGEDASALGGLLLGGGGGGDGAVTVSCEKENGDAARAAVPPLSLSPPPPARGVSGGGTGRLDGDLWWCDGTGGGGGLTGAGDEKVGMPRPPFGDREAVEATRFGGVAGGRKACFSWGGGADRAAGANPSITQDQPGRGGIGIRHEREVRTAGTPQDMNARGLGLVERRQVLRG